MNLDNREVVAVVTKPVPEKQRGEKATQGRVLIVSVKRETIRKKEREPIRPDGLVIRPRLIYHQEEGPVGPEGLP